MPTEIELVSASYEPLGAAEIPTPGEDAGEPEVVILGGRAFVKTTEHTSTDHAAGVTVRLPTTYREATLYSDQG